MAQHTPATSRAGTFGAILRVMMRRAINAAHPRDK